MPKPVSMGHLCDRMATLARERGLATLSNWLKMSANEAYLNHLMLEQSTDQRIGVFDWDVANDANYTNEVCSSFFDLCPREAAEGHSIAKIVSRLHPHDVPHFNAELERTVRHGGSFHAEYRVVLGTSMRWLRADGHCAVDVDGRPIRLLGSVVDITPEKSRVPGR